MPALHADPQHLLARHPLPNTDLSVSILALGGGPVQRKQVYKFGAQQNAEQAMDGIHCAIDAGINLIDTSPLYWDSELVVGEALAGRREEVVLSTKVGMFQDRRIDRRDDALRSIEQSLQRLATDRFDILFFHSLQDFVPWSQLAGEDKILAALVEAREQGLVKYLGVSGHDPNRLIEGMRMEMFDVAMTAYEYHLFSLKALPVVDEAQRLNMGLLNAGPLAGGLLNGDDPDDMEPRRRDRLSEDQVAQIRHWIARCREYDYPLPALNLRFSVLTAPFASTILGMRNRQEVNEALKSLEREPPQQLWDEVLAWKSAG